MGSCQGLTTDDAADPKVTALPEALMIGDNIRVTCAPAVEPPAMNANTVLAAGGLRYESLEDADIPSPEIIARDGRGVLL